MSLRLPVWHGQHDNFEGADADEKGQPTAGVSEQLVEADIGAWTDSDNTTVITNATPPPAQTLPQTDEHSIRLADGNFDTDLSHS